MNDLLQDLRYGARVLAATPAFTTVAVITLALGIAGVVTVFSFTDAMFLRRLPVPHATRLTQINRGDAGAYTISYRAYATYRDRTRSFETLAAHYSTAPLYARFDNVAQEIPGAVVTWNYFPLLGIQPALGRFFTEAEDSVPLRDAVAVISYDLWQTRYGGDAAVLGKTIVLNSVPFTIVGVAPKGFGGVEMGVAPNALWMPAMMLPVGYRFCDALRGDKQTDGSPMPWECATLQMIGALRPRTDVAQAAAELNGLRSQVRIAGWWEPPGALVVENVRGTRVIGRTYFSLLVERLAGAAALLLLIACANVAGLLLARGVGRTREFATRRALGAGAERLVRQLLAESLLLAACGCALGLLLTEWCAPVLIGFYQVSGTSQPIANGGRYYDLHTDAIVIAVAIAVAVGTALVAGALPALTAARLAIAPSLKVAAGSGSRRLRGHGVLATVQIALCVALVGATTLLVRSVWHVEYAAGFDPAGVVGLRLRPRLVAYPTAKAQAFTREVLRRVGALPQVRSVALTRPLGWVWAEGDEGRLTDVPVTFHFQAVSPRYFETLRIPLIRGREFVDSDNASAETVVAVNETLARRIWNSTDVLDRDLRYNGARYRVVAVVKDAVLSNLTTGPIPEAYFSYWQDVVGTELDARLAVRLNGDVAAGLASVQAAIVAIDSSVPITEVGSILDQVRDKYTDLRVVSAVLAAAAALGVLLSALGLYSLIAFGVRQKTREIGVHMAIGARPGQVVRPFLRNGLRLAAIGCAAGLCLSLATSRLLGAWLFGVSAVDPTALIASPLGVFLIAALASYLPSRAAAAVDPLTALRHE